MVMTKTNIELLVQLTVPEPGAPPATRASAVGPAFDDHLRQLQAASPPPEPPRQTTAADKRNETTTPAAVQEQSHGNDESNQRSAPTSDNDPEHAQQATEPNGEQQPATPDSEAAPADDNATETEAPAHKDTKDTNDAGEQCDAAEAVAAAVVGQAQLVATDEAVAQQVLDSNTTDADTPSADQAKPGQRVPEAKQAIAAKGAAAEVDVPHTTRTPAVLVDEQPADRAAAIGAAAVKAKPTARATTTEADAPDPAQTKAVKQRRSATGTADHHSAVQLQPAGPADQNKSQQDRDKQSSVVAPRDNSKPGSDKTAIASRATKVTAPTDQGQPTARGTTPTKPGAPNPVVVGAAVAESVAGPAERTTSADDAGSRTQRTDPGGGRADGVLSSLGRFHRGSAAGHGNRIGDGRDVPQVDPARFVSRVARAFETAQQRGGTLHLRLSPPELGSVKLEMTFRHGVMTASLETETAAARQTLLHHLPALRERLAEQNIRVERFDVDVRQEGGGQSSMGPRQHPQQPPSNDAAIRTPSVTTEPPQQVPTVVPRIDGTGINVIA